MSDLKLNEPQSGKGTRRPWLVPELRTMRAGSAEAGANPNAAEGMIAKGS